MSATERFFCSPDSPHGLAKKVILYRYLQGRFSELLNHKNIHGCQYQFIYFDAFSGKGKYQGESNVDANNIPFHDPSYGSPIVALDALFSAMIHTYTSCSILLIFEDKNEDYLKELKDNTQCFFQNRVMAMKEEQIFLNVYQIASSNDKNSYFIYKVKNRKKVEFQVEIKIVHSLFADFNIMENMPNFAKTPVISFIDPFGYSQTPMSKVKKFIGYRKEILITFMTSYIRRFGSQFSEHINKLFGTNEKQQWK